MQKTNTHRPPSRLRCAIYTRKSTEEGLDQEFNSLEAQRELGKGSGGRWKGHVRWR